MMGRITNKWNIYCPKGFIDARDRERSFTIYKSGFFTDNIISKTALFLEI